MVKGKRDKYYAWRRRLMHEVDDRSLEAVVGGRVKPQPDGCWLWTGPKTEHGYGVVYCDRNEPAHRFVYRTLAGPILDGHVLHHECENTLCVNPQHLTPLTPSEHTRLHAQKRRAS